MNNILRNVLLGILLVALGAGAAFGIMRWQESSVDETTSPTTQTATTEPTTKAPAAGTPSQPTLANQPQALTPTEEEARNPNGPWRHDLRMATSQDGTTFGTSFLFEERSGVPSVTRDASGRLIASFQWFPKNNDAAWDRIAVVFSSDEGTTWTDPETIFISDFPSDYMRPFDPTVTLTADGKIRMFFTLNTSNMFDKSHIPFIGSAISSDGISYAFEEGTRLAVSGKNVIDSAATLVNGTWHLTAPASKVGAYHATSTDGTTFTRQDDIASASRNWTGNLVAWGSGMRFYGTAGPGNLWWSYSADGSTWTTPETTNVPGGDPAVVRKTDGSYLLIYVGGDKK